MTGMEKIKWGTGERCVCVLGGGAILNMVVRVPNKEDDTSVKTRKGDGGSHMETQWKEHSGRRQELWHEEHF